VFFRYLDRVASLAGGWRFSSFPGWEGVLGRLLDSLALPVAASGQQVGEDVEDRVVARLVLAGGPDGGGVVAGDADGHGEGDPVRIDSRLPGGLRFQRAQCLVDGQEGEEFLADEVRSLGPEDERRSTQPGLQLTVAVFDLPALMVDRCELRCRCLLMVQQGGGQPERLGPGAAVSGGSSSRCRFSRQPDTSITSSTRSGVISLVKTPRSTGYAGRPEAASTGAGMTD
jgi:hypothetical protein